MNIVDVGAGPPIVVIPGIQGRWEWMAPAIDALARSCRVVTFSLADEPTAGGRFDDGRGFWCYVDQVRDALDASGVERAAICGVSYGGLVAAAFAARYPERTAALVLVSAIPPWWTPTRIVRFYLRAPRLLAPIFCVASLRLYLEIASAAPGVLDGIAMALRYAWRVVTHPFSPGRMARRARLLSEVALTGEVSAVEAPVLIVTGEPPLDRVVPVATTLGYLKLWPDATVASIARTGHIGLVTRPDEFARIVGGFAAGSAQAPGAGRRRVG